MIAASKTNNSLTFNLVFGMEEEKGMGFVDYFVNITGPYQKKMRSNYLYC